MPAGALETRTPHNQKKDLPSPQFPGLRCFYHAKFGLWRVVDDDTGTEIPRTNWPRGLTAATREEEPMPPGPVATEDTQEEEPNYGLLWPALLVHAPSGSSYDAIRQGSSTRCC